MKATSIFVMSTLAVLCAFEHASAGVDLQHKWVYCSQNLLVDKNVDDLLAVMERAKKAGYNGILLADYKFNILGSMDRRYFDNARRVIAKAKELDIEIIPAVFPIGYASGILAHDPNLIEGLPVKEAPFVVKEGKFVPLMPDGTKLLNGDFEDVKDGRFTGWWQEDVGKSVFADTKVVKSGKVSVRMQDIGKNSPQHGHCRLHQIIKTEPFKAYHLSVWIKTQDFENPSGVKLQVLATSFPNTLQFEEMKIKRTQDWTQYHVAFNSLNHDEVRIYCGVWGGKSGTLWWDGLTMEPLGFVNVIRRDSCPVKIFASPPLPPGAVSSSPLPPGEGRVRANAGGLPLEEGKDFSQIIDPKLGNERYPGTFASWHTPPVVTIPAGSRLKEGDRVLASYCHPIIVHGSQVACSLVEPKVFEILDDQMKRVHELFGAKSYMMSHDEIRVGGWTSEYDGMTVGEALAKNVKRCREIVAKHAPEARVYVWSDMFDPNHNARDEYYLVKTTWAGSWEGLSKDVVLVDWYARQAPATMEFFGRRGHEQVMAGYYDGNVAANVRQWMDAARASSAKITGIMYTTWRQDYGKLEEFMAEVRRHK